MGSISSGKSTLAKMLGEELGSPYYLEDIDNGLIKNMLEYFYSAGEESRSRVSAMLQVSFLVVRFQQLKKALVQHNAILDSNLLSDFIMASNLHNRGEMDDASYNVYMTLNQEMQGSVNGSPFNGFPDLVVYLDISPEHEIQEIQERGRDIEDINKDKKLVDYYHSVNKAFKDWYNGYSQSPVLRIDRDELDFVNNEQDRQKVFDLIKSKLKELGKL